MLIEGPELSIIIPVLNEAGTIGECLWRLQTLRKRGVEIIVVDGGSQDATVTLASPLADRVIHSKQGRAVQMNTGATQATGRILLFLHVDTRLPEQAYKTILQSMELPHVWGRFDVKLSGRHSMFRMIEQMMNLRSGLTGIATGDQAIFVTRSAYDSVGGFPDYPLMEDLEISKRLKKLAFPVCLKAKVITSSRRWEKNGIFRTIGVMWWLRFLYFLGTHPRVLQRAYDKG